MHNHRIDYKDVLEVMKGKTVVEIEGLSQYSDEVIIRCENGYNFILFHDQDCCETVLLEDFEGDAGDVIGGKIIELKETTESGDDSWGSYTWTFYELVTTIGSIWMRWKGESNGYYSERVDVARLVG